MADPTLRLPDVPDVLHHVFSYLDPIHYSDEEIHTSHRSLAMAARTCRGFSGLALDVLWKRLPNDQPLAELLCTIGIAAREHKQGGTALLNENVERHQAPRREQRLRAWRHAKGYDIQYVSIYGIREKHILFNVHFPVLGLLVGCWRSTSTSWLAPFRGVRYPRPRHLPVRLRCPHMVQTLGTAAACYRRCSYFTQARLRGVLPRCPDQASSLPGGTCSCSSLGTHAQLQHQA